MDAFDADVIVYAAVAGHPLGGRVRTLFRTAQEVGQLAGCGSVLLLPEVLSKPVRDGAMGEVSDLGELLGLLQLLPVDEQTARLATVLAAGYRLRAADAVHLATAVNVGADRFVTNNRKDFPKSIAEIEVVYPLDLPEA